MLPKMLILVKVRHEPLHHSAEVALTTSAAKKIKADLILRAKAKKQYAKVLKQEGMQSDRLKQRDAVLPIASSSRSDPVEEAGSGSEDGHKSDASSIEGEVVNTSKRSGSGARDEQRRLGRAGPAPSASGAGRRDPSSSSAARYKGKGRAETDRPRFDRRNPRESAAPAAPTARKVRALSPTDVGPPMPLSSFREMKKEAFSKYHDPKRKHGAGEPFGPGASRGSGGRGPRGQPNMGARMGALLEKIKRDRA